MAELHLPVAEAAQWVRDPATREFLRFLQEEVRERQEQWTQRRFERGDPHEWLMANASALAEIDFMQRLLRMFDDIVEREKEDENEQQQQLWTAGDRQHGAGAPA